jgi:hypothetical protein
VHISGRKDPLRKTLSILVFVKKGVVFLDEKRMYGRSSHSLSLDSYLVKSENFLLTSYAPSSPPSPQRGEGKGEGKISNVFG